MSSLQKTTATVLAVLLAVTLYGLWHNQDPPPPAAPPETTPNGAVPVIDQTTLGTAPRHHRRGDTAGAVRGEHRRPRARPRLQRRTACHRGTPTGPEPGGPGHPGARGRGAEAPDGRRRHAQHPRAEDGPGG